MNRIIPIALLLLLAPLLPAQDAGEVQALELLSGEVKCGTIVFRSAEVVVIQTETGAKFQYPAAEISDIRPATEADLRPETLEETDRPQPAFGMIAAAQLGLCGVPNQGLNGFADLRLMLGVRHLFPERIYLGLGTGITRIFITDNPSQFIPLFLHMNTHFRSRQLSPDFSLSAGYMFRASGEHGGGLFTELAAGIKYRTGSRTDLHFGAFFRAQQTRTTLAQEINHTTYGYEGNAAILGGGIRLALSF